MRLAKLNSEEEQAEQSRPRAKVPAQARNSTGEKKARQGASRAIAGLSRASTGCDLCSKNIIMGAREMTQDRNTSGRDLELLPLALNSAQAPLGEVPEHHPL